MDTETKDKTKVKKPKAKIAIGLGAVGAVAASAISVVACASPAKEPKPSDTNTDPKDDPTKEDDTSIPNTNEGSKANPTKKEPKPGDTNTGSKANPTKNADISVDQINNIIRANINKKPSQIKEIKGGDLQNGVHCEFTINSYDNEKGTITYTATLTKGDQTIKTLNGIKNGYLTNSLEKINKVNEKTLNANIRDDSSRLPSEIGALASGILPSSHVKYVFTKTQPDNDKGTISWSATLTLGTASKPITGTKDGYLTSAQKAKADAIRDVNAVTRGAINKLISPEPTALPSVVKPISPKKTQSGVTCTLTITHRDDVNGTISWTATLKKGQARQTVTGVKTGYLTSAQKANGEAINAVTTDDLNGLITADPLKLPSETKSIAPGVIKGVSYSFAITQDDAKGEIHWTATLSKGQSRKPVTGVKTGYLTTSDANANIAAVNALKSQEAVNRLITAESTKLPSEVQPISGKTQNGVSYSIVINKGDDATGIINWTATLTKGQARQTVTGTKSGFRKQVISSIISAVTPDTINALITPNPTKLPSEITIPTLHTQSGVKIVLTLSNPSNAHGSFDWSALLTYGRTAQPKTIKGTKTGCLSYAIIDANTRVINAFSTEDVNALITTDPNSLTPDSLGGGTTDNGIHYEFLSVAPRTDLGMIRWTVKLSKGSSHRTFGGRKSGWLTLDQKLINSLTPAIIKSNINIDSTKLPTEMDDTKTFYVKGVKVVLTLSNKNNDQGSFDWSAVLTKGNAKSKTITGSEINCLTTAQRDVNVVTRDTIDALITPDPTKLPSEITTQPFNTQSKVHVVIALSNQNNDQGTLSWTATLTKGNANPATFTGTKYGYLTTDHKFLNGVTDTDINNLITANPNALPSQIPDFQAQDTDTKMHVVFPVMSKDDDQGTISWTATLTKGSVQTTITGTKSGYLTTDQKFLKGVTDTDINNLITANPNALPSQIPDFQAQDTDTKMHVVFAISSKDDDQGTISWTATLTKGSAQTTISGKKSGYSTKAQLPINLVTESVVNELIHPDSSHLPPTNAPSPIVISTTGVTITFNRWTKHLYSATVDWTATLSKAGSTSKHIHGTARGYQSPQEFLNSITADDLRSLPKGYPNVQVFRPVITDRQYDFPKLMNAHYAFSDVKRDASSGTISLKVHLSLGRFTRDFDTVVTGFKRLSSNELIQKVNALRDMGIYVERASTNPIPRGDTNLLASKFPKPHSPGITSSGLHYEITDWTPHDSIGEVHIRYIVQKDDKKGIYEITLKGFTNWTPNSDFM